MSTSSATARMSDTLDREREERAMQAVGYVDLASRTAPQPQAKQQLDQIDFPVSPGDVDALQAAAVNANRAKGAMLKAACSGGSNNPAIRNTYATNDFPRCLQATNSKKPFW